MQYRAQLQYPALQELLDTEFQDPALVAVVDQFRKAAEDRSNGGLGEGDACQVVVEILEEGA